MAIGRCCAIVKTGSRFFAMTQLAEAVARYHKLLESEPFSVSDWVEEFQKKILAAGLKDGARPICPVLRPHFLSRRQFNALTKAAELLIRAAGRIITAALENPAILARLHLLPAEKMLAAVNPGYTDTAVFALADTELNGAGMSFLSASAGIPPGLAGGAALADLFFDLPLVKQFRRNYNLEKINDPKLLATSIQEAYQQFGGHRKPRVGILDFRPLYQTADPAAAQLLKELLSQERLQVEIVQPDQLEYKARSLRQGEFVIDLVVHRMRVHEFLLRFDLMHPLIRAYREHTVCLVNSFRSELLHKRSIFALLQDETLTADFPAAEKKVIQQHVPWTRLVAPGKTRYGNKTVDLLEFILKNREKLILKPNDDSGEEHAVAGWLTDDAGWERALKRATRAPYVVQERVDYPPVAFPVYRFGSIEMKALQVVVQPHVCLGKSESCSSWVSEATTGGFSSISGLAPTFILEPKP